MIGKKVLNAGCGFIDMMQNPYAEMTFKDWEVIKLDVVEQTKADIVNDIREMTDVKDSSFDGIWSQHVLEHLHTGDVHKTLGEFYRVLKPGGVLALYIPDMGKVAKMIIENPDLERVVYVSDAGCIRLIDIIFGYERTILEGNPFMLHKTAFTEFTVTKQLSTAGFCKIKVIYEEVDLFITAYKVG
jgi:SAM-dependent methyltransferase